jgi:hypothetical protein
MIRMAPTPWLNGLLSAVAAPTQVWCDPSGEIEGSTGAQGIWHGDVRVLRSAELRVDGVPPELLTSGPEGVSGMRSLGVARNVTDHLRVERRRDLAAGSVREEILLRSTEPVRVRVEVVVTGDLAPMDAVRGGRPVPVRRPDGPGTWSSEGVTARIAAEGAEPVGDGETVTFGWDAVVTPGEPWRTAWRLDAEDGSAVVVGAPPAGWRVETSTVDVRLERWLDRALADLEALRMAPVEEPRDVFVAAGSPWFLTLFGRDSLWTARLVLPLGWELAASTLRALAARQGKRHDPATAEEPGKIMHELRRGTAQHGDVVLPPVYYGTIDATSLWVVLLHEAWRAGMPHDQVAALLPNLQAALAWHTAHGDEFLRYLDESGTGLANQGWKDSDDSVQWHDGRLAQAPIALCEVQGYAYQAVVAGAELLEHFDLPTGEIRAWATALREKFRAEFWVHRDGRSFPAIALDRQGRAVDSLTSNVGHLLGTGILSADEARTVADHLCSPELSDGFGLRTLASDAAGFDPSSYHCGAVWAHDTAIAITGLVREGFRAEADVLVEGLLAAAEGFAYRMPELHGGDARDAVPRPVPYPTACRPQGWSAAAAVAVLGACASA